MSKETTSVETLDMDIESLLNPGADSVMLPSSENDKQSIFSRKGTDISFLDKPPVADTTPDNPEAKPPVTPVELDEMINGDDNSTSGSKNGRPKMDKEGLVELANKLIDKKLLVPFDDGKPITEYTIKDFEELFEANAEDKERKIRDEVPSQFFESLPPELQYAAKYVADGGADLKGLFKTLSVIEEVKSLDPSNENDQRAIVRSYLQATNFGTPDEIEEEINDWDDRGDLESKANKFKPKLDALSEKQVQYQLQQQEVLNKQRQEQADLYTNNIYKTLEPAEINGIKIDKKTQNLLFSGLVQPNYQSVSGKQTNLLGHLLEKYQFIEPNHSLVAEALWLLADPDGYKNKVREVNKKEVVAETVRKLKTEEKGKISSNIANDEDESGNKKTANGIPRSSQNFFKRN